MKLYKDKMFLGFGLAAGIFSLIVYFLTKSPTLSFWDCGEFIACADILGVPHPPGYPLFALIGRFAILLLPFFETAVRVNMVSVISSAAAVFAAYWLIIRLVIGFDKEISDLWQKLALAVGGFVGSLIIGFSATFWDNAIEAECYGLAMMLMIILSYLLLLWSSRIGKPGSGKLMVAIAYLAFLSVGIHLTTFLIMPIFVIYMAIKDRQLLTDWRFWGAWIIMLMIIAQIDIFLYGSVIVLITSLALMIGNRKAAYMTKLVFALSAATIIGYSTHLYLPIRAAEKPAINENNPDNWERFKSLLERKQYGQESMITRMFDRRGTWANQFGTMEHMGFWGYFREQFSLPWAAFIYFALGFWGIYETFRRNRINGLWLLTLFLASTVGLILYLNFSDGTRGAILEVRDRDYFYTPGFVYFGILFGVGLTALLYDLAIWVKGRDERKYLIGAVLFIALLLPIHTLQANYFKHDRSRNFLPWDYAHNILSSIDQNGIVFTNGDNDTFPLWYIQEVEGFRKDVRVVNLSLLNTPWYVHQLKDQMNVPITLSDEEIEDLRPIWDSAKDRVWRVQDKMVSHIIMANKWQQPIYFAVTVAGDNRLNLDDNLIMEGMGYRLVPSTGKDRVDPEKMREYYMDTFMFRGLNDSTIYKNENDTRLVANYISGFLQLADTLKRAGDVDEAIKVTKRSIEVYPSDWRHRMYLSALYSENGRFGEIGALLEGVAPSEATKICVNAAQEALYNEHKTEARNLLNLALQYDPNSVVAFNNMVFLEDELGNTSVVDSMTAAWRLSHASDPEAQSSLDNLLRALDARRKSRSETQNK